MASNNNNNNNSSSKSPAYETEAQPLPEVVISKTANNPNPNPSPSPSPTPTPTSNSHTPLTPATPASPPPYIYSPDSLSNHNALQQDVEMRNIQPVQDASIHPTPAPEPLRPEPIPSSPQPPVVQQVVYTQYGMATPLASIGQAPTPVDCPVCGYREMTRIEPHSGNTTHGWALVSCICLLLPCIPYLITSLKDVEHLCGHCGVRLATWHNSGRVVVHQSQRQMPYQSQSQSQYQSQYQPQYYQPQYQSPEAPKHTGSNTGIDKSPTVTGP